MSNPFDNEEGTFFLLRNTKGEHSLWPAFVEVPAGWAVQHGPDHKQGCLARIEKEER